MDSDQLLSEKKGYLRVIGAAIFFGLNGVLLRAYFLHRTNPPTIENVAFWGITGATVIASFVYLIHRESRLRVIASIHREGSVIGVVALLSSLGAFLWFLALKRTDAGTVSLLAKSQVIYGTLLGIFFLKERLNGIEGTGILIAVAGVFFIAHFPDDVPYDAALFVMSSAFIYAVQSLVVKRFAPSLHGREFSYLRAVGMSVLYGGLFFFMGKISWIGWWDLLLLSIIATLGLVIGRAMYFSSHKHLPISRISTGMLLEPVFVMVVSAIFLAEAPGVYKIGGGAMILTGVYLTVHKKKAGKKQNEPMEDSRPAP